MLMAEVCMQLGGCFFKPPASGLNERPVLTLAIHGNKV